MGDGAGADAAAGVTVAAVYVDPVDFGAPPEVASPLEALFNNEIPAYVVRRAARSTRV